MKKSLRERIEQAALDDAVEGEALILHLQSLLESVRCDNCGERNLNCDRWEDSASFRRAGFCENWQPIAAERKEA